MEESQPAAAASEMLRLARELVPLLLQGADPRLELLRQQWLQCAVSISNASPAGFYADIAVPALVPRVQEPSQCSGEASVPVQGAEHPAGCILYVVEGALAFLEVYNIADWEQAPLFGQPTLVQPFSFMAPGSTAGQGA